MKNFLKENWFKVGILAVLAVAGAFSVYYFAVVRVSENNFALQAKCADDAAKAFARGDYQKTDEYGGGYDYKNHYNAKQNKCFILITYYAPKSDILGIDLYDALGGQHYAMYFGHSSCDPMALLAFNEPKKCQLDSGSIWFDGNDARNPADYQVGFQGAAVGPGVGDENTQKQFLEHIQPYMNE